MAVNPNFTNANATTPFYASGGGGGSNASFNSISLNSSTGANPAGQLSWEKNPGSTGVVLVPTYWAGQAGYDLTLSCVQYPAGVYTTDNLGVEGIKFAPTGGPTFQSIPYGYIQGSNDGILITGQAANTGALTQTWFEAHNGASKVLCVSTMTNSAKTNTLDFNAFISTMASVYPAIVKPYSATG